MPQNSGTEVPDGAGIVLPVIAIRTIRVVHWGMALWAVILLILLLAPGLRDDGRQWWIWVPVSGLALGAIGHVYLARGRGNAADA